jgi:EmrB/QacA subfamily drug resistance transporter
VVICCSALFMVTLDNTILTIALPSLQREFVAATSGLQWAINSYVVVRAATLFTSGSIADRFGRRRCFAIGLLIFITASLACALSQSLVQLVVCRAVQAAGGALMTPASLAIIVNSFDNPVRRAQSLGVWSATAGLSTAGGPVIGGVLVQAFGWRSIFLVNVPVGLAALIGTRLLAESKSDVGRRFDLLGQGTLGLAHFALTFGLISAPSLGWTDPAVVAPLCAAAGLGATFVVIERRVREPMLDLARFRQPSLAAAVVIAIVAFMAMSGFTFFNTLYMQEIRGFSPVSTALLTLPTTALGLVLAPLSGRLTGTRGARLPATAACLLTGLGMVSLAGTVRLDTPLVVLLIGYTLLGLGSGLVNPPITNAAVTSMPARQAAVAAAITSTARQIGTSFGIVVLGSVILSVGSHAASGQVGAEPGAFVTGLQRGYGLAAGLSLVAAVVAVRAFRRVTGGAAERADDLTAG